MATASGITYADLFVVPALVASMVGVSIADFLTGGHLHDLLGIKPRTPWGLLGIVCAPFLHAGWSHLVGNMVPLAALSVMLLIRLGATHSPVWRPYVGLLAAMALLGGTAVWLFARPHSNHAGASGLVFSLAACLLATGVFDAFAMGCPPRCTQRGALSVGCTLVTFVAYGGLLWGLNPTNFFTQWEVSWEGHAFGFAAGVFAGWLVMRHELGRLPSCLSVAVFGRPALQGELLPASTSQGYGTIGGK